MSTNFQKARRRLRLGENQWSDPISYATSSESVEMTDGTDLQTKIDDMDDDLASEVNRATGAENTLDGKITTEKNRAEGAEQTIANNLTTHDNNTTKHITATERTNWNDANSKKHEHSNKSVLDGTTASYTTEEKTKLADIETGAEVNVQSDWNQTTTTADDYIKNKPQNLVSDANYVHTDNNYTTDEKNKLSDIEAGAQVNTVTGIKGDSESSYRTGNINITKANIGLGNVDNTSDANKPVSTATQTALNGKLNTSLKGTANGLAELDANGKVPSSQLPSFVDDVIEGYLYNGKFYKESSHTTEISGESGKIYTDLSTNKTYRWSGTAFVVISDTITLGETSSTAYRGDRGKTAYDHSQSTHARTDATKTEASSTNGNIKINGTETTVYTHPGSGTNPHGTTKSDVGLGNVGNFKAVSTVASQGLTDTEKSNARANIGAGTSSFSGSYNDLSNKPTIPTVPNGFSRVTVGSTNIDADTTTDTLTLVAGSNITLTPDATNDKVTIAASQPTVNNGTLTIQKNGTNVQTFTANQSSNATANITVPTKVSELTNDSGYTTNTGTVTQVKVGSTSYSPSSGVVSLPAYPTSLPASDVYAWAKASTKPTYTASEVGAAASNHTHNYAGSSSAGGAATSLAGFTNTTTTGTAINSATQNGHVYVTGTYDIHGSSDGACFVQAYSTSWVAQIYQDYRTGQIALRSKNNGTWQSWRKVLDNSNLGTYLTKSHITTALGYTPPTTNTTYTFTNKNATLAWSTKSTIATVGGVDITVTMPANPNTDTDTKVTQTATSTNSNYEVLFSATADNTTRTEGARKYSNFLFNPSTGNLQVTQLNGVTIGSSPKFTDTNTWRPVGTGATDAAAGNHTHTTSIATSTGTNKLTLAFGTKYAITAGGTSYVFTMPANPNTDTKVTQTATTGYGFYPILFGNTANSKNTVTDSAGKDGNMAFYYNPSSRIMYLDHGFYTTTVQPGEITVESSDSDTYVSMSSNDLETNSTWDGTNTSLKSAISALNSNIVYDTKITTPKTVNGGSTDLLSYDAPAGKYFIILQGQAVSTGAGRYDIYGNVGNTLAFSFTGNSPYPSNCTIGFVSLTNTTRILMYTWCTAGYTLNNYCMQIIKVG